MPDIVLPLSLENPSPLQVIYVAGYPFDDAAPSSVMITKGLVISLAGVDENNSIMQIFAALQPGNSGGPVMDEYGNIVSVAIAKQDFAKVVVQSGTLPEDTDFGVKSSAVYELLRRNNVKHPPPNKKKLDIPDVENRLSEGALLLSCWMTSAEIKKFRTRKVMFSNL